MAETSHHPCSKTPTDLICRKKDRYYQDKLRIHTRDPAGMRNAVVSFIQGLHWVLEYYYRGVVSWGWYYPYHYAPMASDMTNLGPISVHFERGEPFTPFQQLLAVLPAASHKLLPKPYQVCIYPSLCPVNGTC